MEALNGVRQGGILSSMIFTYYINGVIKEIKKMNIGCYLRSEKTSIIAFADDIFLLSASVKGLQMLVNRAAELLTDLCLSINVKNLYYYINGVLKEIKKLNIGCYLKSEKTF